MTLYLKYRPQALPDLDLEEVRNVLIKSLASKEIPHAWLFSGPRGTGKTSAARILAKYLNCDVKKGDKPCNKCDMCQEITAGSAVDVVEIDAASNRGIDEIRELREKLRLAPMRAKFKVYIIDEVHMLTTEAANALLKTLEEPPEATVFVLCTTDPGRLPETVVSRCSRVIFRKPKIDEIEGKLERIVKVEGYKFGKEDLKILAKAAKGSFRDGIKLLEQAVMSGGDVNQIVGLASAGSGEDLLEMVEKGEVNSALEMIAKMDQQGENFRRLVESMVELVRERLLEKAVSGDVSREVSWIQQLEQVYEQMKTAVVPQLPLEIWVIQNGVSDAKHSDRQDQGKKAVSHRDDNSPSSPPLNLRGGSEGGDIQEVGAGGGVKKNASGRGKYKLDDINGRWTEVMKAVRPMNHSVEALLRSTRPMEFDGERLELEVFYKFHKDKLETEKCRRIVEEAVEQVIGETGVKLYLKLGQKAKQAIEEITADGVDDEVVAAAEEIFGASAI